MDEHHILFLDLYDAILPLVQRGKESGMSDSEIVYTVVLAAEDCCKKLNMAKNIKKKLSVN